MNLFPEKLNNVSKAKIRIYFYLRIIFTYNSFFAGKAPETRASFPEFPSCGPNQ